MDCPHPARIKIVADFNLVDWPSLIYPCPESAACTLEIVEGSGLLDQSSSIEQIV